MTMSPEAIEQIAGMDFMPPCYALVLRTAAEEMGRQRALVDAVMSGLWRPIATAPNDYSVVLLYQPAKPGFAEAVGQGHRTDLREHAHDKWVFQGTGFIAEPTHWMPLPNPPST